jgi:glycosyltransferase involved in cell wall biosynthesis
MKLAIIVPGGFDPSGRARVIPALLWLVERLAERNEVHVFVTADAPAPSVYRLAGATVHVLGGAAGLPVVRTLRRWRVLVCELAVVARSGRIDVVHGFWAGTSGVLAVLAGRRIAAPSVVSIGGGELVWLPDLGYGGQGHWRSRMLAALALRLADAVTGGSRYALTPLAGRVRAHCIPLGVDCAQFATQVARPPGPPWHLIHVGSINRIKDQETLLCALRLIVDEEPGILLEWVGEDTLGGALQRRCEALGLAAHVAFHGFKPSDEVAALYRTAHVNILSSRHESQAVVVSEAAAAGLPTVGTAVGVVAELAPAAALAVPVGDAAALAAGVLALLRDPARRAQIGQSAQAWAQQYDADWTAAQFEGLYQALYEQARRRHR